MVIPQHTNGIPEMTAYTDVDRAQQFARVLENKEAILLGVPVKVAREHIARRLKSSPGFFQNLRNNRIKRVPSWLMDKIREAFIAELQKEVQRLQHEIHIARQTGLGASDDEILAAETQIEEVKKLLGGK